MKVAFITDIHGNYVALRAVLRAIEDESVDDIVCLGDLVVPCPFPYEVLSLLKAYSVTVVKGNGEDKLLSCFNAGSITNIHSLVNFQPTLRIASMLDSSYHQFLLELPLTLQYRLGKEQALLCHGTPVNCADFLFYMDGRANQGALRQIPERNVICGHNHWDRQLTYQDKVITYAGSVGLLYAGAYIGNYLLVDDTSAVLTHNWKRVPYNGGEFVQALLDNDFLRQDSPISWMLFDEVLTQEARLSSFFKTEGNSRIPNTIEAWSGRCRKYLESIGRWSIVESYL